MQTANGILLLYDHPLEPNAPTIMEHVDAFARHSSFDVWSVNTGLGFPKTLGELDFSIVLLHYSLFGIVPFKLDEYFERYLDAASAYKIAFFQDEYQFCRERFSCCAATTSTASTRCSSPSGGRRSTASTRACRSSSTTSRATSPRISSRLPAA